MTESVSSHHSVATLEEDVISVASEKDLEYASVVTVQKKKIKAMMKKVELPPMKVEEDAFFNQG